jgi:hypothetical protein
MAILALCARYTKELARLENEWWQRPARVEVLGALAQSRNRIDQHGDDPAKNSPSKPAPADVQHTLEQAPGTGADNFGPTPTGHPTSGYERVHAACILLSHRLRSSVSARSAASCSTQA